MHIILRNKVLIIAALLLTGKSALAQKNLPMYDYKKIHYGFTVGAGSTHFRARMSPDFLLNDSLRSAIISPQAGFNLGVLMDIRLSDHLNFRMIPSLSFAQRNITYDFVNTKRSVAKIESTYLEFPFVLKLKSDRHRNWRFYVLSGLMFGYDLASNKTAVRKPNEAFLSVNPVNLSYQMGLGFDIYFSYFKFSPELKITNGINNVLTKDNTIYSSAFQSLFSRIVQFNLYFE